MRISESLPSNPQKDAVAEDRKIRRHKRSKTQNTKKQETNNFLLTLLLHTGIVETTTENRNKKIYFHYEQL